MTVPPNPPQFPQGLGYYPGPIGPQRPASIQVISIIAIILGALGVLCNGLSTLASILSLMMSSAVAYQQMHQTPAMKLFALAQYTVGLALAVILLAGGIGGIQVRRWARVLLIRWAIADLLYHAITGALGFYFAIAVSLPAVRQQIQNRGGPRPPPGLLSGMTFAAGGVVILMSVLGCILPICVLIFWRKPQVVRAFEEPQSL